MATVLVWLGGAEEAKGARLAIYNIRGTGSHVGPVNTVRSGEVGVMVVDLQTMTVAFIYANVLGSGPGAGKKLFPAGPFPITLWFTQAGGGKFHAIFGYASGGIGSDTATILNGEFVTGLASWLSIDPRSGVDLLPKTMKGTKFYVGANPQLFYSKMTMSYLLDVRSSVAANQSWQSLETVINSYYASYLAKGFTLY